MRRHSAIELRAQRLPLQQFRDDVRHASLRVGVEDGDDVGVVQAAGGARFAREARHVLGVGGGPANDLQGDIASEGVDRAPVDLAHAAGTEQPDDLVRAEALARREGEQLC